MTNVFPLDSTIRVPLTRSPVAAGEVPSAVTSAGYHRLSIFLLEQRAGEPPLDMARMRELYSGRDGFSLKSFRDKFGLRPVGFNLFRTVWDESTAGVMERAGVPGADLQFKHRQVHSLKPDKPARGWEAKRQKPKYRQLWKYSKRIHGFGLGRRR